MPTSDRQPPARERQKNALNPQPPAPGVRVAVLATGGTIAMRYDAGAGGAVPALGPGDLTTELPVEFAELQVEDLVRLPSSHFRLDTLRLIRQRVSELVKDPSVCGVVVTHGTDTLEETAYLLDLTVPTEKPVVLTGAMHAASDVAYDGKANLVNAIRVAGTPAARYLGVTVVFNDEIHAARHVTKMHTLSTAAFQSPGWGLVGRLEGDVVALRCRLEQHVLPWRGMEPNVSLLKLGLGMEADLLEAAVAQGARGVVIEAFGGGRVPPWWLSAIQEARGQGLTVVIVSRCPSGRVWDSYGYPGAYRTLADLGCLFGEGLNGQKARIKLMVVLAAAQQTDEIARLWARG